MPILKRYKALVTDTELTNEYNATVFAEDEDHARRKLKDEYALHCDTTMDMIEVSGIELMTERLFEVFLKDKDGIVFRDEVNAPDIEEAKRFAVELRAEKYGVTEDWYSVSNASDIQDVPVKIRRIFDDVFKDDHEVHFDWKGKDFIILSANDISMRIKSPTGKISEIPRISFMEDISVAERAKNPPEVKKEVKMNEVSCGSCGGKFKHEVGYEGDLKCPHCGMEDEQCHFPDTDTTECHICGAVIDDFPSGKEDTCPDCLKKIMEDGKTEDEERGIKGKFTINDIEWGETKYHQERNDRTYTSFKCGKLWGISDLDGQGYYNIYPFTTEEEYREGKENRGEGYNSFEENEEESEEYIVKLANEYANKVVREKPTDNKNVGSKFWDRLHVLTDSMDVKDYPRLESTITEFFVKKGVMKERDFWPHEGSKYWDLQKLFVDKMDILDVVDAEEFMVELEEEFGESDTKKVGVDDLLGELDGAIEEHKDSEQSETEKICLGVASQSDEFIAGIDNQIDTAYDALVKMMQANKVLASSLSNSMKGFPGAKRAAIEKEAKKVHDSYTASLPSDTKLEFDDIFKTAILRAMDAQKLNSRTYIESDYSFAMAGTEYSEKNLKIDDPETWFKKYNDDDSNGRYRSLPEAEDFRWLKLRFNHKLILDVCREKYGSLEDIRDRSNDTFMTKFISDYTSISRGISGYGVEKDFKEALESAGKNESAFRAVIKEYLQGSFKSNLITASVYISKDYNDRHYIDLSRWNSFSVFSDINRVFRAATNGVRISEIPANNAEGSLFRPFGDGWRVEHFPFGTSVESDFPIKDWCESYTIYKNGNVKIRVKAGVSDKIVNYILDHAVDYTKKTLKK